MFGPEEADSEKVKAAKRTLVEAISRRFIVEYVTYKENAEFESPVSSPAHKRQKTQNEVRKPFMFTNAYSLLKKRRNPEDNERFPEWKCQEESLKRPCWDSTKTLLWSNYQRDKSHSSPDRPSLGSDLGKMFDYY